MRQSNKDNTPHVAYTFDAGFRYCSVLSAYSVLKHRRGATRISFFTGQELPGMAAAVVLLQKAFPEAEITLSVRPELDHDLNTGNHLPAAAYARLLLPRFVTGRVLYLDGDTCARRDIASLYQTNMQGKAFGAVIDSVIEQSMYYTTTWRIFRKTRPYMLPLIDNAHLFDLWRYINSGVLLLDFDRARELALLDKVFDPQAAVNFISKYQLGFADQDWLNHIVAGDFHILDPVWNAMWGSRRSNRPPLPRARRRAYHASRNDPAILHFAGGLKPWEERGRNLFSGARKWDLEYKGLMRDMTARLGVELTNTLL